MGLHFSLPLLLFGKFGTSVNLLQLGEAIFRIRLRSQKAGAAEKGEKLPEFAARGGFYEMCLLAPKRGPGEQSGSTAVISSGEGLLWGARLLTLPLLARLPLPTQ